MLRQAQEHRPKLIVCGGSAYPRTVDTAEFRKIAARFWSGNRALIGAAISKGYEEAGVTPPAAPERLASALIAMDIGLALQHFVDPEGAPLDLYPDLYELLFSPLDPAR